KRPWLMPWPFCFGKRLSATITESTHFHVNGVIMRTPSFALALLFAAAGALAPAAGQDNAVGPDKKTWEEVAAKAAWFLRSSQDKNGGWSTEKSPGVTGVVLTGLLRSGQVTAKGPVAEKALSYIESLVNPEKGHIAGKDPKVQLQN